eukprot:scaffold7153_cov255-Prasinococcus_capsulatus_cf.AAC.3
MQGPKDSPQRDSSATWLHRVHALRMYAASPGGTVSVDAFLGSHQRIPEERVVEPRLPPAQARVLHTTDGHYQGDPANPEQHTGEQGSKALAPLRGIHRDGVRCSPEVTSLSYLEPQLSTERDGPAQRLVITATVTRQGSAAARSLSDRKIGETPKKFPHKLP